MITIITRTREELVEQLDMYDTPHDEFDSLVDAIIKGASYCLMGKFEKAKSNDCYVQWGRIAYHDQNKVQISEEKEMKPIALKPEVVKHINGKEELIAYLEECGVSDEDLDDLVEMIKTCCSTECSILAKCYDDEGNVEYKQQGRILYHRDGK